MQEMAAVHPLVWRKVLLTCRLIHAEWYNAICDAMQGPGCDGNNWEYKGEVISEHVSDSCPEAAQLHCVAAQNDIL